MTPARLNGCLRGREGKEKIGPSRSISSITHVILQKMVQAVLTLLPMSLLMSLCVHAAGNGNVFGIGAYFPPGVGQIDDAAPLVGKGGSVSRVASDYSKLGQRHMLPTWVLS